MLNSILSADFPLKATNKKSGCPYVVTGIRIDATNVTAGRLMVEYEDSLGKYVKDVAEFEQKFDWTESPRHTVDYPELS